MSGWIGEVMEGLGAFGVFLLMFLENIFPPIPSEVVLPYAGFLASQGRLSLVLGFTGAVLGSLAGVTLWYLAARWYGLDRLKSFAQKNGRLLTLTPKDIDDVDAWFDRYGGWAVLFGRMVPGVRTLISIPAGLSGMTLRRFLILSAIGTAGWSVILVALGYWLGERYQAVGTYIGPVSNAILGGALIYYLYRVLTFRKSAG